MDSGHLPPGTQIIEDIAGKQLVLAPQPSADPNQPLNWSKRRKAVHLVVLSFYTLMAFAWLQVSVPMWTIFKDDLGLSYDILNNGFALSQVTLATGCIFFIPLAARFGRRPVYIISGLILIASGIWSCKMYTAGDNYGSSIILGLGSCVNEALFQVSVADLFFVHERGTINGIYIAVQMIGTYLTPVASGYAAVSRIGWRGTFVVSTIIMGVCVVIMIFLLEETKYIPRVIDGEVLLRTDSGSSAVDKTLQEPIRTHSSKCIPEHNIEASEANTERYANPNESTLVNEQGRRVPVDNSIQMGGIRTRLALVTTTPKGHAVVGIWESLTRPFVILFTFPAVLFTAIQYGFLLAMVCILSITQTQLYASPPYNFSAAGIGNMNIAPAIGCILGSIYGGPVNDWCIRRVAHKRGGVYEPETRLWMFFFPGIFLPAGTLLYGLTIAKGMPWPVNAVGAGFIGFALGGCGDIVLTYCQDCYQHIIGDALTGVVFVRNIVSCPVVFAINPWIQGMGVYNMFVMLGCFAVAIVLTAVPLVLWGRAWRIKSGPKYERYSGRTYD